MIEDTEELAILQRQLAIVEKIVESWRQQLLPHNPKNYAIYAEGAIEQAEKLKAEIDEYLAQRKSTLPDANGAQASTGLQPSKAT